MCFVRATRTHMLYIYMHIYTASIHYSVARVSSRVVDDYSKVMRSGWRSYHERASLIYFPQPKTRHIVQSLSFHRGN